MHPFEIVSSDSDNATIATTCPSCGKVSLLKVSNAGLRARERGALIQVAFPGLSPDDRELFVSGLCASCFPKDEEDPAGELAADEVAGDQMDDDPSNWS